MTGLVPNLLALHSMQMGMPEKVDHTLTEFLKYTLYHLRTSFGDSDINLQIFDVRQDA